MRRVVITGVGLVTSLGVGTRETWDGILAGRSGIGRITGFDPSSLRTQLGAETPTLEPRDFADRRSLRLMTREDVFAMAGAALAVEDAGLDLPELAPERVALYLGGHKAVSDPLKVGDALLAARDDDGVATMQRLAADGIPKFFPLFYVEGLQAAAVFYISQKYGLKGPNAYFHGTADAGAAAIGRAFRAVRRGEADVALAGGFDAPVWWWPMSHMDTLGVLTDRNELGAEAFRPYDRERSGSVLGEGAAFVVLEAEAGARARGAEAYAAVAGFGGGHDATGLLTPHPDGRGLAVALRACLRDARTAADEVDYVAAHGCATRKGDPSETAALRDVFASAAEQVAVSSVKPATGHLVAAAGALNVAVAALAVRDGAVPPTLHLTDPDPACALDHVPGEARAQPVDTALALGRGLEGQNVALAVTSI